MFSKFFRGVPREKPAKHIQTHKTTYNNLHNKTNNKTKTKGTTLFNSLRAGGTVAAATRFHPTHGRQLPEVPGARDVWGQQPGSASMSKLRSTTPSSLTAKTVIGQYKAITAQNGFNRRISDECQEAQDNQFWGFLALKLSFLSSGTMKIGSGRSNLYIGRWSRGCLTPQIAGTRQ